MNVPESVLPITVFESGEDLYARPYAIRPGHPMHFEYVQLSEFWPYRDHTQAWHLDPQIYCGGNPDHTGRARLLLFWHLSVRRFFHALKFSWQWRIRRRIPRLRLYYGLVYPLYCYSFSRCCFSISHQLHLHDPDGLTQDSYLAPSDQYIAGRIAQIERGEGPYDNTQDLETFLEWRAALPEDAQIHYVVELNS